PLCVLCVLRGEFPFLLLLLCVLRGEFLFLLRPLRCAPLRVPCAALRPFELLRVATARCELHALGVVAFELDRDSLRDAALFHRHAVERLAFGHRALVMRDDDELRLADELLEEDDEALDVRLVERRVDLVEHAEGARARTEDREEEGDRRHRLLAARHERERRELLSGWTRDDLDSRVEHVDARFELELGAAASERFPEELAEVLLHAREGLGEHLAALAIDVVDERAELSLALVEILFLSALELVAALELLDLVDGFEVDAAELAKLILELADLLPRAVAVPIRIGLEIAREEVLGPSLGLDQSRSAFPSGLL